MRLTRKIRPHSEPLGFAQIVPPSEMVVLVTLETKIGDVEGMINLCIPYITIEPIISKLSAQYMYASVRSGGTTESLNILRSRISNVNVNLIAEIGSLDIKVKDVVNLKAGDFVRLPGVRYDGEIILKIGNRNKFRCKPGIVGKKMAVQITGLLEDNDRDKFDELQAEGEENE